MVEGLGILSEHEMNLQAWSTKFGEEYTTRNNPNLDARREIFDCLLDTLDYPKNALEIGCNKGSNVIVLNWLNIPTLGIEVNKFAIKESTIPHKIIKGEAQNIPFVDDTFDFILTAGLLIHIHETVVKDVLKEIIRVSKKYICLIEYVGENKKIPYRENVGLYLRNYSDYLLNEGLNIVKNGAISDFGFDDGTDFSRTCSYVVAKK